MKQIQLILLLILINTYVFGQDKNVIFLQVKNKIVNYYIELGVDEAKVYTMGSHYNPHAALKGYSIRRIDTLGKESDGTFKNKHLKISNDDKKLYLTIELIQGKNKIKKIVLDTVKKLDEYNHNLNNAYYLDSYFAMYDELNKTYPLSNLDRRISTWQDWGKNPNRYLDHFQFKELSDRQLSKMRDSIKTLQDSNVRLTNYLSDNLQSIDYSVIKDSVAKLSSKKNSRYYREIIKKIARQQPEYFFKIAEDFPKNEGDIFFAVDNDKQLINQLKAVEGHKETKQRFIKYVRSGKIIEIVMPIIGVLILVIVIF